MAMRDLPWGKYLHGEHHEKIIKAYETEMSSLLSTVLRELPEDHPERAAAEAGFTNGRMLLEFKRSGVFKCRYVLQGFKENKLKLDGPDFDYSSNVVGITAVRMMMLGCRPSDHAVAQRDISTAFLQSHPFPEDAPPRYVRLKDPVTGVMRFFRQLGPIYGSNSAPKYWEETLHPWLTSIGFVQGKNEPCLFRHPELDVTLATYVDDLLALGPRANVAKVMDMVAERFKCKDTVWLGEGQPLDHLGMCFFETKTHTCLSMSNYIDIMVKKLDVDVTSGRMPVQPFTSPITDLTPLTPAQGQFLMTACGMIGWLAGTGRPDLRFSHQCISQHMASPNRGALQAVIQAVRYASATRDLCLMQPKGTGHLWCHYSDSDHAGNTEPQNNRRCQLGFVSMCGDVPMAWGSKTTSVRFGPESDAAEGSCPSFGKPHAAGGIPRCHPDIGDLHPDVSSGAAEIYAASVALNEILHLSYIAEEMGASMDKPLHIKIDNTAAIAFANGRVRRSKLKHIDVRQEWVQALRDHSVVQAEYVNTKSNKADFFTKILDNETFLKFRGDLMRLCPPPATPAT